MKPVFRTATLVLAIAATLGELEVQGQASDLVQRLQQ